MTSTGTTLVPTPAANDSSQKAATTSWVTTCVTAQVAALLNGAPGALDPLKELADAMGDDPNFRTTILNAIAAKLSLAGGTMTGALALYAGSTTPTAAAGTGGQGVASQGYADAAAAGKVNRSGDSMQALTVTSLTSPTVTSPTGQNLLLQAGGVTGAEVDTDGFVRLAAALPRTANDSRAARADYVLALGRRFSGQTVITGTRRSRRPSAVEHCCCRVTPSTCRSEPAASPRVTPRT